MGGSILVIEDDLDLQYMYKDILTSNGFDVDTASDGEEGISKYKEGKFDLVLMDSDMPKLNGFQSFLKIKEYDNNAKVVIITGYSGQEQIFEDLMRKGLESIITKPIGLDDMLELVKKYSK